MRRVRHIAIIGFFVSACALLDALPSQAQDQPPKSTEWQEGEIEAVEITITKEREITLPKANRNFEKVPPRPHEPINPPITYDFNVFTFTTPQINPAIRPLKLKESTSSGDFFGGYLSLGYGNYSTPYLDAYLNTRKDKNKLVGARAWLMRSGKGPVDGKNSGGGTAGINLFGKTFGKAIAVEGNLGYENRSTHFYGYPEGEQVAQDTIQQAFNAISLGAFLSNSKNTDFSYKLGGSFSHLADKFDARETEAHLLFHSAYEMSEDNLIRLKADYYAISRKDALVDVKPRSIFTLDAGYYFEPESDFKAKAGLIFGYENDTLDAKNVHIYPDLEASYKISPTLDVIGSLTGGIDRVSLHTLYLENLWLAPNIAIANTNRTYELAFGLNAKASNKIELHAGIALAGLKNWYFYRNQVQDQSKFELVFDEGTTKRSNLYGALSYAQSTKSSFMLRADVYSYAPKSEQEAWHRPTFKVAANGSVNIYDKILVKGGLIMQGGMKAQDRQTLEVVKLKSAFDLNAKAEYLFSESFSFFIQFNNITGNKYPIFYNYPVRGFQVLGGINWSF